MKVVDKKIDRTDAVQEVSRPTSNDLLLVELPVNAKLRIEYHELVGEFAAGTLG